MIFITLGTQACDLSRCMRMVEEWVRKYNIEETIVAQTGYTCYKPKGIHCFDFVLEEKYQQYINDASIIISHAGTGSLFSSIKRNKKVIAVARLQKFGEMIDDHQTEIVEKLSGENFVIDGTYSIIKAWEKIKDFTPSSFDFENNVALEVANCLNDWVG